MNKRAGLLLTAVATIAIAPVAKAQESPTSTWNSSVTWRSPYERAADLSVAEAQQRARRGGYGPGQIVYNDEVTVTTNNEYNGDVNNTSATTATNLNSFASTVNQTGSSTASVHFQTGNTAYNTNQNATAVNSSSSNGTIDSNNQ